MRLCSSVCLGRHRLHPLRHPRQTFAQVTARPPPSYRIPRRQRPNANAAGHSGVPEQRTAWPRKNYPACNSSGGPASSSTSSSLPSSGSEEEEGSLMGSSPGKGAHKPPCSRAPDPQMFSVRQETSFEVPGCSVGK